MTRMELTADPGGFALKRSTPTLGLLSAVDLPHGVTLFIDLDHPLQVHGVMGDATGPAADLLSALIGPDAVEAAAAAQEHAAHELGPLDGEVEVIEVAPPAAEAYLRLALVAGIHQWAQAPLDESVLACDYAVTASDAGCVETAEELARDHARHLAEVGQGLLDDPRTSAAALRELATVAREVAQQLPDSQDDVAEALRDVAALAQARGGILGDADYAKFLHVVPFRGAGPARVAIDPAQVPARVVKINADGRGDIDVELGDDEITVRIPAFPSLDPGSPSASSLFARLITSDGVAFSTGILSLTNRQFVGTIPLFGESADHFEVDVFHGDSRRPARAGAAAADEKQALAIAQAAFTQERMALAAWVSGGTPAEPREFLRAGRSVVVGGTRLTGDLGAARVARQSALESSIDALDAGQYDAQAESEVLRPTLAELAAPILHGRWAAE